ncbi:MAG: helix-turn-helix transcriptional regulator [Cytophagales bacterium]|nr:helix-turn-helix transcriptional regulator [Cytophagales bacterium]
MQRTHLGEFEELVLLIVGALQEEAYSMSIRTELSKTADRKPSIGALHAALNRLEDKGFISSHEGGATSERGGRRKRFYEITDAGKEVLRSSYELRSGWYKLIPGLS